MMLSTDNKELAESKLMILYILNKVHKPISNDALLKLVISTTDMNYFYFQQFLLDLINSKFIECNSIENESIYTMTDSGKEVLELTKNILPGLQKFKIDNGFKENLEQIQNDLSISAEYFPETENEYTIKCKIIENTKTIFEINTPVGSIDNAKAIVHNWEKNASFIYPKILEILSTNYLEENK